MKGGTSPISDSLRPLFLAIARANVAGSMAGCIAEQLVEDEAAGSPPSEAWAVDGGPLLPRYDPGVALDELRITREECSWRLYRERLTAAPHGTLALASHIELKDSLCVIGRRPAGLRAFAAGDGRTRIGAFLAQAAHLEAASVYAFYKLLRELRALGAPEALRAAALDAMLDEIRHAHDVRELARAYGGEVQRPKVEATGLRSAYEMALDNIGEGCVRETFGALQATYQAETAADPQVRRVMAQIAEDESRHSELAWKLHAWLEPQLSAAERTRVEEQRARVLDALVAHLDVGLSHEEYAALGFPTPEVSGNMLRSLSQVLYA